MKTEYFKSKLYLTALSTIAMVVIQPSVRSDWKSGDVFPNLASLALEESSTTIEGKITLVDFWASWCGPCKTSFPSMDALYNDYKDKGFQILAINVDENMKAKDNFLKRMKPSFDVALDSQKKAVQSAGVETMPTSYLLDRQGVIRFVHNGWHGKKSSEELSAQIEELLKEDS